MRYRAAVLSEYGLLVALIAVVAVAGVTLFGGAVANFFACLPTTLGLSKATSVSVNGQTVTCVTR